VLAQSLLMNGDPAVKVVAIKNGNDLLHRVPDNSISVSRTSVFRDLLDDCNLLPVIRFRRCHPGRRSINTLHDGWRYCSR
jgi:hypothetical protein